MPESVVNLVAAAVSPGPALSVAAREPDEGAARHGYQSIFPGGHREGAVDRSGGGPGSSSPRLTECSIRAPWRRRLGSLDLRAGDGSEFRCWYYACRVARQPPSITLVAPFARHLPMTDVWTSVGVIVGVKRW
jgi:hypothetical protein